MPDRVTLVAGWGCLGIGLLFMVQGTRLIRTERRLGRRPLAGETFSGREVLAEGVAFALVAAGNLLGGRWVLLAVPGVIVMVVLAVHLVMRWARRLSGRSH
ncbi:hypothetical protein [Micromonospora globispora]|nr:hypothetical protein [Micromonospora globispora]